MLNALNATSLRLSVQVFLYKPAGNSRAVAITGISELTLEARNLDALCKFYTRGFGLVEIDRERDRIWLGIGDRARLGLWKPGAKEFGDEGGSHVHFALTVEPGTLDAIAQRLRARGVEVEGPLEHRGGDRSLYARDPEGNVVEAWDFFERGRTVRSLEQAA
jgi:catechol-2,3-dioxygenase